MNYIFMRAVVKYNNKVLACGIYVLIGCNMGEGLCG